MFINNRVIYKDNTAFSDISGILSDPYAGKQSFSIVAAEDALFVGSDMPFNHRFFMLGAKNSISGTVAVAIWNGTEFVACEDVEDGTSVGGVPFARSGLIRFALPEDQGWSSVTDSSEITDFASLSRTVKANYWAKITFSAAFVFEMEYVGFRFARDADLKTYYRDLLSERVMTAFNDGQPMQNWDQVHVVAAEQIIRDLRADEIIFSPNQVMDPETFTDAACHKLAEIVFKQTRNEERKNDAMGDYKKSMAKRVFNVSKRGDGRLRSEDKVASWRLKRV